MGAFLVSFTLPVMVAGKPVDCATVNWVNRRRHNNPCATLRMARSSGREMFFIYSKSWLINNNRSNKPVQVCLHGYFAIGIESKAVF
jgi:hypothetical protein